jgi:hypothetical protein
MNRTEILPVWNFCCSEERQETGKRNYMVGLKAVSVMGKRKRKGS